MDKEVIFINMPKPFLKQPDAQAPLGILYLASIMENIGVSVQVKNYAGYTDADALTDLPRANMYGITVVSMEIPRANMFARLIKIKYPDAKVILGGPGIFSLEALDWIEGSIDGVCAGEGERIVGKIYKDCLKGEVERFYRGEKVGNLDTIPFPARHLMEGKQGGNIFANNKQYMDGESAVITSSRGCNHRCSFCSAPSLNPKIRFRSEDNVVSEIAHVMAEYGIKQFRFSDDSFTASKRRVLSLCEKLGPLNIAWRISCRVKPLDEDMLRAMKDAGCKELSFGIESFDDDVLNGLNKGTTGFENAEALHLADKVGFDVRVLFMIRTPFQTRNTVEKNQWWIRRVPFTVIACTSYVPIPGSDVWNNPDKYGVEILSRDLNDYNFYMFGPEGKHDLKPLIKLVDRPLDEFMAESEDFRNWLINIQNVNRG